MLSTISKGASADLHFSELTDSIILLKDLHNLANPKSSQSLSDSELVQQEIDNKIIRDGNKIIHVLKNIKNN